MSGSSALKAFALVALAIISLPESSWGGGPPDRSREINLRKMWRQGHWYPSTYKEHAKSPCKVDGGRDAAVDFYFKAAANRPDTFLSQDDADDVLKAEGTSKLWNENCIPAID